MHYRYYHYSCTTVLEYIIYGLFICTSSANTASLEQHRTWQHNTLTCPASGCTILCRGHSSLTCFDILKLWSRDSYDEHASSKVLPRTWACYSLHVDATRQNMILPDLPEALPYTGQKQKQKWIITPRFTHFCDFSPSLYEQKQKQFWFHFCWPPTPPTDNLSPTKMDFIFVGFPGQQQ